MDVRWYQILALSALLILGRLYFGFVVGLEHVLFALVPALLAQYLFCYWKALRFQPLSPVISVLSIVLLMRADSLWWFALAGLVAVASKFLFRWRSKHIFNPTNFSICLLLLNGSVWVSPGQWGQLILFMAALTLLGAFITRKVQRLQMSFGFLLFFFALVFSRALYLGDPLALAMHQLKSGSLYIFAFYMLSDPRTTPNAPAGRLLFSFMVALLAYILRFHFYLQDGVFFALAGVCLLTPIFDMFFKDDIFIWKPVRRLS